MDVISEAAFTPWKVKTPQSYESIYHFGVSEAESDFALMVSGGVVTAQICSGGWAKNPERWQKEYKTLTNVRIVASHFYSNETEGDFVTFLDESEKVYGLRVKKYRDGKRPEVGARVGKLGDYYSGKYALAFYEVLAPAQLTKYSREELALMRNKVFARYGHAFSKNEKMRLYFKKQEWYQPEKVSLDLILTPVEKKNLLTLQAAEANAALPK